LPKILLPTFNLDFAKWINMDPNPAEALKDKLEQLQVTGMV
jgi:hypothetical protein